MDNNVTYKCLDCNAPFEVTQGSKQRYCDTCLLKRVRQGRPKKNNAKDRARQLHEDIENDKILLRNHQELNKQINESVVGYSKDKQLRKQKP